MITIYNPINLMGYNMTTRRYGSADDEFFPPYIVLQIWGKGSGALHGGNPAILMTTYDPQKALERVRRAEIRFLEIGLTAVNVLEIRHCLPYWCHEVGGLIQRVKVSTLEKEVKRTVSIFGSLVSGETYRQLVKDGHFEGNTVPEQTYGEDDER